MLQLTSETPRILIVDDEDEIKQVLLELLSAQFNCEVSSTAEEALDRLGKS